MEPHTSKTLVANSRNSQVTLRIEHRIIRTQDLEGNQHPYLSCHGDWVRMILSGSHLAHPTNPYQLPMDNKNTSLCFCSGGWWDVSENRKPEMKALSRAYAYKLGSNISPPVPGWFKPPWPNLISLFGGHVYNQLTWQPLGPLLKVTLLVGYIRYEKSH